MAKRHRMSGGWEGGKSRSRSQGWWLQGHPSASLSPPRQGNNHQELSKKITTEWERQFMFSLFPWKEMFCSVWKNRKIWERASKHCSLGHLSQKRRFWFIISFWGGNQAPRVITFQKWCKGRVWGWEEGTTTCQQQHLTSSSSLAPEQEQTKDFLTEGLLLSLVWAWHRHQQHSHLLPGRTTAMTTPKQNLKLLSALEGGPGWNKTCK